MKYSASLAKFVASCDRWLRCFGAVSAPPVLRVALALPFLRSGRTRWEGFHLSFATPFLFEDVFKLHLFGHLVDLPLPLASAYAVSIAELLLPVLLLLGLGTRFASLGLLIMTGVIQLVVPDGWANFHLYWVAIALSILALGPGALSLDRLLSNWVQRSTTSGMKTLPEGLS